MVPVRSVYVMLIEGIGNGYKIWTSDIMQ